MAAVNVPAAPAMGLLIVDSMTVPVDQRYSEGMLGAFSLIAGVCLVKDGGETYHWVVDVRRKPPIEPPTWPTLPPPFTPAFTRRKNACKASSTPLRVATARLRCAPALTGSSWRTSVSSRHWLGKVIDVAPFLDGAVVKPAMTCKPAVVVAGELDAKLVRARSVILLHAASTYPRRLLLKSPGLHPWRRYHRG